MSDKIIFGAPLWVLPATLVVLAGIVFLVWSYWCGGLARPGAPGRTAALLVAALLKLAGIGLLAICLVEPLFSGIRPRTGANVFGLLIDNSRSMQIRAPGDSRTQQERIEVALSESSSWQARLAQDFDVRTYAFDARLQRVADVAELSFGGPASALGASLETVATRFRNRPVAGLLLFSDGNDTSSQGERRDWSQLGFPVYPVVFGPEDTPRDVWLGNVSVTQSNFETAPITLAGEARSSGLSDQRIVVQLVDANGKQIEEQILAAPAEGRPAEFRFRFRPESPGVSFYKIHAFPESNRRLYARGKRGQEATLANNVRNVAVDRGGGPYRILYVAGRPNWEFKFVRRAVQEDVEINLVGLLRIAKKEPKFSFRDKSVTSSNPLFQGFEDVVEDEKEQYDQPVLLRLGTEDKDELRDGFPQTSAELFAYDAILLDDVEAGFFTAEQLLLLRKFVADRGGGLLLMGGQESFREGGYQRTALGELSPIYLDRSAGEHPTSELRFQLTREGRLQSWTRLRSTEQAEQRRLESMPGFKTYNPVGEIKPGASVLATATENDGTTRPALVVQRFGKGQSGALLIGDLWRWGMHRPEGSPDDLPQAWRQTIRWLVRDVPKQIEISVRPPSDPGRPVEFQVLVRDEEFRLLGNASVALRGVTPSGESFELTGEASEDQVGVYTSTYTPREDGGYTVEAVATAADGSEIARRKTGWASQPGAEEFRNLQSNRRLLETIAEQTGGMVVKRSQLPKFVKDLPNRKVPVTEKWTYPLWHQLWLFGLAMLCLCGEWGIRRWKGLP